MIDISAMIDVGLLAQLQPVAQSTGDTLVMKTVPAERSTFETITSVASGLMSIALLVLAAALTPAAWNFRRSHKRINELLDRVYGDINPIVRHTSTIADNLDYITTSIRVDIQQVNQTIAEANQRLNHALALSEQRLNEFNALLQVVQQEAEDAFVTTAATVRGVRTGASVFREEALVPPARARPAAGVGPGTMPSGDDHDEEILHGDHGSTGAGHSRVEGGPRIRPRPRGELS